MIEVRPASLDDVALLARHVKPELRLHESRARLQAQNRAVYLVAWEDAAPVGHALLKLPPLGGEHPHPRGIPEVEDLLVAEGRRSRGIGSHLMRSVEEEARRRRYDRLGLAVGVDNPGARRFYRRLGYFDAGFGEFDLTWCWTDDHGNERHGGERCTYLVKLL